MEFSALRSDDETKTNWNVKLVVEGVGICCFDSSDEFNGAVEMLVDGNHTEKIRDFVGSLAAVGKAVKKFAIDEEHLATLGKYECKD